MNWGPVETNYDESRKNKDLQQRLTRVKIKKEVVSGFLIKGKQMDWDGALAECFAQPLIRSIYRS